MTCAWYPKPFIAGDMTGEGSQDILGRPAVDPIELLIRETVQNSWDACLPGRTPYFRIDYRRLTEPQQAAITTKVLTGSAPGVDLQDTLENNPWVFEIVDWNTKGLGGPTRVGEIPPPGQPSDFADLILKMGAKRDAHLGGGSYGFGKTATYVMSECDTIIVWTRCRVHGRVEDRFIASALGHEFTMNRSTYTGRQWWGRVNDGHPEPVIGPDAHALGESVFTHRFGPNDTGTAIMILAADRSAGDEEWGPQYVGEKMRDATLWHLWPKLVPERDGRASMSLDVRSEGVDVPIPDPRVHPILSGFCVALQAVRDVQSGRVHDDFNTEVHEIWCLKPRRLTGHLAIHRWPSTASAGTPSGPVSSPVSNVALMRHRAELMVRYDSQPALPGALQWAGVFKPVERTDDAFTDAEPPSHDDWVPANVKSKENRTIVNVSLTRIAEKLPKLSAPGSREDSEPRGTAQLAGALADLASPLGSAPSANTGAPASRARKTGSRNSGPKPAIVRVVRKPEPGPRTRFALEISCEGAKETVRARLDARIATEGGKPEDAPDLILLRSLAGSPIGSEIDIAPGQSSWVVVDVPAGLAIDARVTTGAPS